MNANQQADQPAITPGWRLSQRYYPEVMKHGGECIFCDEIAGWKWENFDSNGHRIQWLRVCERHRSRLQPSDTDPRVLELNTSRFPRSKSIARDELAEYLNRSDRLFTTDTAPPSLLKGFPEFTHLGLMTKLQEIEAVEPSGHAAGWDMCDHFLVAIRHDDGSWEAIVKAGNTTRRITQPARDPHHTSSKDT